MKRNYKQEQEVNLAPTTLPLFIQYYNQNVPASFPQATKEALEVFKETHPNLFDETGLWTIDKHRKHLMDWLLFYRKAA